MAADIRHQQALRRRGLPEEQAAAIAFLWSEDATFITGQAISCKWRTDSGATVVMLSM